LDKEDSEILRKAVLPDLKELEQIKDFGKFSRQILAALVKYVFAKPS
jgi:hypothetical protein